MRILVTILVSSTLVAACGEVPPAGPDAGPDAAVDPCAGSSLSVEEFFTCFSRAACDLVADCFGSDVTALPCDDLPLNLFGDLQPAAARRVLDDSVSRGRAQWNPTAAAACVDRIRGGCALVAKDSGDLLASCGAIVGNVVDGAGCQADFECATAGARCEDPSGGGLTCGARVCRKPAATGQPCANNAFCGPDDYCVRRFDAGGNDLSVCESGAAGRPCDRGGDCDAGLFCNGGRNDGTAAGTCTTAKPAGSICAEDRECQGELLCVGETSTTTGFCRDVRIPGAACDDLLGCFGHQYCDRPTAGAPGTCRPALAAGAACGGFGGQPWCGVTLACDGGTCQEAGPIGATCARSADGVFSTRPDGCSTGLLCSNAVSGAATGTCEALHADGGACADDGHCASGYCDPLTRRCGPVPLCTF